MAKLVPSDIAPKEDFKFSTAQITVDLPYETDDPDVIANALVHPWVDVDFGEVAVDAPPSTSQTLPAEQDGFSRLNSKANDPELVAEALAARDKVIAPAALDADEEQDTAKNVGTVAITVAAVEEAEPVAVSDTGSNAAPKSTPTKKERK